MRQRDRIISLPRPTRAHLRHHRHHHLSAVSSTLTPRKSDRSRSSARRAGVDARCDHARRTHVEYCRSPAINGRLMRFECADALLPLRLHCGPRVCSRRTMAGNEPMGIWDALMNWLRSLFFGREMEIVVIGAFAVG
jgi:hypothetical protein